MIPRQEEGRKYVRYREMCVPVSAELQKHSALQFTGVELGHVFKTNTEKQKNIQEQVNKVRKLLHIRGHFRKIQC